MQLITVLRGAATACLIGGILFAANPAIQSPTVVPASSPVDAPATVLFTAKVADPQVVPVSVNLQRASVDGSYINVSRLYDDGTNGDAKAGDGIYSVSLPVLEKVPGTLTFRISAAVRGSLSRVFSDPVSFKITSGRS